MRKTLVAVAALLLALTACTDDSSPNTEGDGTSPTPTVSSGTPTPDTAREARAKRNIKQGLLDAQSGLAGTGVTHQEAECLGDAMVDRVGVDKLQRYDILDDDLKVQPDVEPRNLDPQDADAVAQALTDCIDVGRMITEGMGTVGQFSQEQRDCLADAVDEDAFREQLSLTLQGKPADLTQGMRGDMMKCMTPPG
jgi:hypothetical protein